MSSPSFSNQIDKHADKNCKLEHTLQDPTIQKLEKENNFLKETITMLEAKNVALYNNIRRQQQFNLERKNDDIKKLQNFDTKLKIVNVLVLNLQTEIVCILREFGVDFKFYNFLKTHNLLKYLNLFSQQKIDYEAFLCLDKETLEDLKVDTDDVAKILVILGGIKKMYKS